MTFQHRLKFLGILAISPLFLLGSTCSDGEDGQDEDTGLSNISLQDQQDGDTGLSDASSQDTVEESIGCLDISDDEECEARSECTIYIAYEVDAEVSLASDLHCNDYPNDWPPRGFCVREEWAFSFQAAHSAYARHDEENDEWTVYITADTPEGHEEMGFYSCVHIPEDEHPDIRDLCYECR